MPSRRLPPGYPLPLLLVLVPGHAFADADEDESSYDPGRQLRRSDFALSVFAGAAVGQSSGYPNEVAKLDVPEYEAQTGFAAGPAAGFWVGGALRDWFTFGVGYSQYRLSGGGLESTGDVYMAHIEAYPLFAQGGVFRDLGLFADVGAGGRSIEKDGESVAEGGIISTGGVGVVYEPIRLGTHFSAGPTFLVTHQWSQSLAATMAVASFRIVYYGGPG